MSDATRKWLEWAGNALIFAGILMYVASGDFSQMAGGDYLAIHLAFSGLGWLILGIVSRAESRFARAWRNVQYMVAAILGMAFVAEFFAIGSPFSDRQSYWIVVITALGLLVLMPAYLLYSAWPAMRDFFALESQRSPRQPREASRPHVDDGAT